MKKMILKIFLALLYVIPIQSISQSLQENLEKYWHFRDNLKTQFMYYTNDAYYTPGANITAQNRKYEEFLPEEPWDQDMVRWADAPAIHGHYIGVLALEYYLLNENNQDVTETLYELGQALDTYIRLDLAAETMYNWPADYNGFFVRDDIDEAGPASQYFTDQRIISDWVDNFGEYNTVSQDQVWNMLLGLRLVRRLVNDQPILDKAANIASTMMFGMHKDEFPLPPFKRWAIYDPYWGEPVPRGGTWYEVSTQCWAFAKAAGIVSDQNEHYSYSDEVKFVFKAAQLANGTLFEGGEFTINLNVLGGYPVVITLVLEGKSYNAYGNALLSCIINEPAAPCDNTYDWLVRLMNDQKGYHEYEDGVWPHLPAISYVLYGYDGNEFLDRSFYEEKYLNCCPPCGAYNYSYYHNGNHLVNRTDPPWHGVSLFSPAHVDGLSDFGGHYNMLDYMLLYTSYFYNYNRGGLPIYLYVESISQNESKLAARQIDAVSQSDNGYQNNFTAGQTVRLLPGFQAKLGSQVRISIDPNLNYPIYFEKTTNNPCEEESRYQGLSQTKGNVVDREINMNQRIEENPSTGLLNYSDNYNNKQQLRDIAVYPNPCTGVFNVINVEEFKKYDIYSAFGELIASKNINSSKISVDLSGVQNGLYILKLRADNKSKIFKISVAR